MNPLPRQLESGADAGSVPDQTPNPGSDAAIKQGCTCPVMDNWRGDPEMGRIRGFVIVVGCPVHHPTEEAKRA